MKMRFATIAIYALAVIVSACTERPSEAVKVDELPKIYPDYVGVTIPCNIAPLNFEMADEAEAMYVEMTNSKNEALSFSTDIDEDEWQKILVGGDSIRVTVAAKGRDGWKSYVPFYIYVSPDSIDSYVTYRMISPGYQCGGPMDIRTRDLTGFDERVVFSNSQITNSCVNCHSFKKGDPSYFNLHVRGEYGATVINANGMTEYINTKHDSTLTGCVYPYWHPSGRYIAYSNNILRQAFFSNDYSAGRDPQIGKTSSVSIDVVDEESDVVILDTKTNTIIKNNIYSNDTVLENSPSFSPDGKTLYFITARQQKMPDHMRDTRFDICQVSFDETTGRVGNEVDTIVSVSGKGYSATHPRPSYDGRYIVYSRSIYSYFQLYHEDADLWMYDTKSRETWPLEEANSTAQEGWHTWSTNSKWIVFSSKRDDGQFTKLYFTHIDEDGHATKAFVMPQKSPKQFYTNLMVAYNVPELSTGEIKLSQQEIARKLRKKLAQKVGLRND